MDLRIREISISLVARSRWALISEPENCQPSRWVMRFATLSVKNSIRVPVTLILVCVTLMQGCSVGWIVDWETSWPSPDKQHKLIVSTVGIKPHLLVSLETRGVKRTLFSDPWEWYVSFLQTYWSPDSNICGLYITSGKFLLLAFDTTTGRQIDSAVIKDGLRAAIVAKYKLDDRVKKDLSFDPLDWVDTSEALDQYRRMTYGQ